MLIAVENNKLNEVYLEEKESLSKKMCTVVLSALREVG